MAEVRADPVDREDLGLVADLLRAVRAVAAEAMVRGDRAGRLRVVQAGQDLADQALVDLADLEVPVDSVHRPKRSPRSRWPWFARGSIKGPSNRLTLRGESFGGSAAIIKLTLSC